LLAAGATVIALPAVLLAELAADLALQGPRSKLRRVGCVWSAAELAKGFSAPHGGGIPVFDLYPLGDLASVVLRRTPRPDPSVLPLGKIQHGDSADSAVFVETKIGGDGELLLRGPVVPHGAEGAPAVPDAGGFVGTGLHGEPAADGRSLRVKRDPELLQHGGFTIAARELDALYQGFPGFLDAACFTLPDPIVGDRIFAAVVPTPSEAVSLDALHRFLAELGAAPYKFPDKLVVVRDIPRDAQGRIRRDEILTQV
jgi:mycobactin salicyl-AMP ligase